MVSVHDKRDLCQAARNYLEDLSDWTASKLVSYLLKATPWYHQGHLNREFSIQTFFFYLLQWSLSLMELNDILYCFFCKNPYFKHWPKYCRLGINMNRYRQSIRVFKTRVLFPPFYAYPHFWQVYLYIRGIKSGRLCTVKRLEGCAL